jgi:hypothetical protein
MVERKPPGHPGLAFPGRKCRPPASHADLCQPCGRRRRMRRGVPCRCGPGVVPCRDDTRFLLHVEMTGGSAIPKVLYELVTLGTSSPFGDLLVTLVTLLRHRRHRRLGPAPLRETGEPYAGSTDPRSADNGSLMRLAPAVMFHSADPRSSGRATPRARPTARRTRSTPAATWLG